MVSKIKGAKTLRKRFARMIERIPAVMAAALDEQANQMKGRAIALAPELERPLILSALVTKRDTKTTAIRVVSFDTPYAVLRHEAFYNLGPISSRKAPTQDGPVGRKYLERPFKNMTKEILKQTARVPEVVGREVVRTVKGTD